MTNLEIDFADIHFESPLPIRFDSTNISFAVMEVKDARKTTSLILFLRSSLEFHLRE